MADSQNNPPAVAPQGLTEIVTPLEREEILKRLETAARRGRLPGYQPGRDGELFGAEELGHPFDFRLSVRAEGVNGGTRLTWTTRMLPKMPTIFGAVLALSVWPGVWLTDSMLRAYFSGYDYRTWMWYLPVTVLPIPWMWRGFVRRSRESAEGLRDELMAAVSAELNGEKAG
ncbi:MAG: hypothetical protein IT433_11815 [Phycisphaerales bacterium]|nr:hypothetical protein [Phycisphaerales bacterium]